MDLSLKIKKINEFNEYILQDKKSKKEYNLVLEFYGINQPNINDIILLNENLVNKNYEGYAQPYAFEIFDKKDIEINEIDMAGLITKDKKYILKRVYG